MSTARAATPCRPQGIAGSPPARPPAGASTSSICAGTEAAIQRRGLRSRSPCDQGRQNQAEVVILHDPLELVPPSSGFRRRFRSGTALRGSPRRAWLRPFPEFPGHTSPGFPAGRNKTCPGGRANYERLRSRPPERLSAARVRRSSSIKDTSVSIPALRDQGAKQATLVGRARREKEDIPRSQQRRRCQYGGPTTLRFQSAPPLAVQRAALLEFPLAVELRRVEGVDAAVAEVPTSRSPLEPPEAMGRERQAPGRVQRSLRETRPEQVPAVSKALIKP